MNDSRMGHDWWPGTVPDSVSMGERSFLYSSYAFLHNRARRPGALRIGHDTAIYIGAMFDLGPQAEVTIGNYCTLTSAIISTDNQVTIGDYALVSYKVVIADRPFAGPPGCFEGTRAEERDPRGEDIVIGDNVWVGANAILLGGARIGTGAVIGTATVVDGEVEPYSIVAGNPARVVGRVR